MTNIQNQPKFYTYGGNNRPGKEGVDLYFFQSFRFDVLFGKALLCSNQNMPQFDLNEDFKIDKKENGLNNKLRPFVRPPGLEPGTKRL